ncbi:MAG: dihydrofolate reductase [Methyloligella sp.]|nr:MAG: dihydrofolate reductase [Methyloligella sp.]
MRKLTIITFLSLDGVMQGPSSPEEDPSDNFTQGGWASDYWDETMPHVLKEAMSVPYDILFGRKTYDVFASHWPEVESPDPVAKLLNEARKYVFTSSESGLEWDNSVSLSGDIRTEILNLKSQSGPLIQVHGSGELVQSLLKHKLVDELRLWTFPVHVGQGKKLFGSDLPRANYKLKKTEAYSNGVIMSIYEPL